MNAVSGLGLHDFVLDGEYGSEGAKLEQTGRNHFRMTLGTAPNRPTWTNRPQFVIKQGARGNALRLDVAAPVAGGGDCPMNEYAYSWSYDNDEWYPIRFETDSKDYNTFVFPEFTEDRVYFGHQVPLSYEKMVQLIETYQRRPGVAVKDLGKSLQGRTIYRIEISDADSPHFPQDRWVHYFLNTHPGEHNAQWRMVGMIDWLLNDPQARSFRQRSICHFLLLMSVDGPANGWYRVNQQGADMNRSYLHTGSDRERQAHEAYWCQRDFEQLMASEAPVTTIWNMHTWPGAVDPILYPGPEFAQSLGDWTCLRDAIGKHDDHGYIKPLRLTSPSSAYDPQGLITGWNGGPKHQFGLTGVLCEGGAILETKEQNMASGRAMIRGIDEFYKGLRNG